MGRAPCCDKQNVKRGPWSPEEDAKLKSFIEKHGTGGNWIALPHKAGLKRCGKSCRLRWLNYLRPNIKHGEFTDDEDRIICSLYANIGSRWSIIAGQLPGRTDNDVKNYWNTKLKKKLMTMLPSFQKKPSFFPSLPLQTPTPHISDLFSTNNSTPFYTCTTPNFMNFSNNMNMNSFQTTINNHDSNSCLIPNNIISTNENSFCLGFQEDHHHHQNMNNSPILEFHPYPISTNENGSSSDGGSSLTQISYGNCSKNHHTKQQQQQFQIKQEDVLFSHQGFVDQSQDFMINQNYNDEKPKGYNLNVHERSLHLHSEVEEVKKLIGNINSICSSSSIMLDYDDEYKTTRDDKEIYHHY